MKSVPNCAIKGAAVKSSSKTQKLRTKPQNMERVTKYLLLLAIVLTVFQASIEARRVASTMRNPNIAHNSDGGLMASLSSSMSKQRFFTPQHCQGAHVSSNLHYTLEPDAPGDVMLDEEGPKSGGSGCQSGKSDVDGYVGSTSEPDPNQPDVEDVGHTSEPDPNQPGVEDVVHTSEPDPNQPDVEDVGHTAEPDPPGVENFGHTAEPDPRGFENVAPTSEPDPPGVENVGHSAEPDPPSVANVGHTAEPDPPGVENLGYTIEPDPYGVDNVGHTAEPDPPGVENVGHTAEPDPPGVEEGPNSGGSGYMSGQYGKGFP